MAFGVGLSFYFSFKYFKVPLNARVIGCVLATGFAASFLRGYSVHGTERTLRKNARTSVRIHARAMLPGESLVGLILALVLLVGLAVYELYVRFLRNRARGYRLVSEGH